MGERKINLKKNLIDIFFQIKKYLSFKLKNYKIFFVVYIVEN